MTASTPRWKLTEAHYLKVKGTFWEHQQVDRKTGKPARKQYPVPLHLDPLSLDDMVNHGQMDPNMPSNNPEDWMIVVAHGESTFTKDVIFEGEPTPGMLPLNDEARAISEKFSQGQWQPTRGIDEDSQRDSFSNKIINGLLDQVHTLKESVQTGATVIPGMAEFMETMQAMMKQQTEIIGMLAQAQTKSAGGAPRSVVRG